MGILIDFTKILQDKKLAEEKHQLDMEASYICLRRCLNYLNLNNIKELEEVKRHIENSIIKISKLRITYIKKDE